MDGRQAVVLYDGDCPFCRWAVRAILRWDRRGRVLAAAIQSAEGARILDDLDQGQRMDSWHLVRADGRRFSAGAAAPELLHLLPGGRVLAAGAARLPRSTERAYRWVARHRAGLARLGFRASPGAVEAARR